MICWKIAGAVLILKNSSAVWNRRPFWKGFLIPGASSEEKFKVQGSRFGWLLTLNFEL
jgi:hypothetical protein